MEGDVGGLGFGFADVSSLVEGSVRAGLTFFGDDVVERCFFRTLEASVIFDLWLIFRALCFTSAQIVWNSIFRGSFWDNDLWFGGSFMRFIIDRSSGNAAFGFKIIDSSFRTDCTLSSGNIEDGLGFLTFNTSLSVPERSLGATISNVIVDGSSIDVIFNEII